MGRVNSSWWCAGEEVWSLKDCRVQYALTRLWEKSKVSDFLAVVSVPSAHC